MKRFGRGEENSKKKEHIVDCQGGEEKEQKNFEKAPLLVKNFFYRWQERSKNTRDTTYYLRTRTTRTRKRERERERERGSTFSERKMSATPSALKASSREENAEEENVLVSRDDDEEEGEEREEREERERGASVGKEEEQEECVVFFFSLVIYF